MKRVWNYFDFAVWFIGLGTILLWLFDLPEHRMLPPSLRSTGLMAVMFVVVRVLLLAVRRWRAGSTIATTRGRRPPAEVLRSPRPAPAPPLPTVKPRRHFGLRHRPH